LLVSRNQPECNRLRRNIGRYPRRFYLSEGYSYFQSEYRWLRRQRRCHEVLPLIYRRNKFVSSKSNLQPIWDRCTEFVHQT